MNYCTADLNEAFLKNQLIAYIGNKRRLLGFLSEVFTELAERGSAGSVISFGDCFAGSGSVSRLAKSMGFSVASNDWEWYSNIINTAHLRLSPSGLDALFRDWGGISAVLDHPDRRLAMAAFRHADPADRPAIAGR